MKATVKRFHSPDIDDLRGFVPTECDNFAYLMQVIVGPEDEAGEESFDVLVVTPSWLAKHHKPDDIIVGRHHLIVFEYDFVRIAEFINSYVSRCEGDSWSEVANQIGRIGMWEFEDYRE